MRNKKKLLFCLQTMVCGGVEKELITVLKKLNPECFDVDVLLLYIQDQSIVSEIPQWIHVVNLDIDQSFYCGSSMAIAKAKLKRGKLMEAGVLLGERALRIGMTGSNQSIKEIPELPQQYDCAVCYHIHSPLTLKYVATKVRAKRKLGWIHNDFKTSGYPIQRLKKYLQCYDAFVAVSGAVKREFVDRCPEYQKVTFVAHNVVDEVEIRALARDIPTSDSYFRDTRVKLLTVGRFTEQKGIDQAIEICRNLRKKGIVFCWYFIGWGPEEDSYRALISKYELQECAVILGQKKNPYPYIDNCDVYVQPSRHEAFAMVIQEARALCKPIVCTNFAGANEQLTDGETGYIVPLNDIEALEEKLRFLLANADDRQRLSDNLRRETLDNSCEKILNVLLGE